MASHVFASTRSADVVLTLHTAASRWGYPQRFLSDNGRIFVNPKGEQIGALEIELLALGIKTKQSRPYQPQTCGKVERFHQTMKKYLAAQEPATTKKQLQGLDRFVASYNSVHPRRSLGRRTPLEAFSAHVKAVPSNPSIDVSGYRVRSDKVDKAGRVTLRYRGKLSASGWAMPMPAGGSCSWSPGSMSRSSPWTTPHRCATSPWTRAWTTSACLLGAGPEIPDRALGQITGVLASGLLSESQRVPLRAGATS